MQFKEVTVVQSGEGGGLLETPAPRIFERDPAAENLVINLYPVELPGHSLSTFVIPA
jgi:hypothetical protein